MSPGFGQREIHVSAGRWSRKLVLPLAGVCALTQGVLPVQAQRTPSKVVVARLFGRGGQNGRTVRSRESVTTTTALVSSKATFTLGQTVTFTATVASAHGMPSGLVTFFDGPTPLGSAILHEGSREVEATFSTSILAASAPHSITAMYQGDANHAASASSPTVERVQPPANPAAAAESVQAPALASYHFSRTSPPLTGRAGFTSTLFAEGMVLIAGGTDAGNHVLDSAEIYSSAGATFTKTSLLNTARTGSAAVLLRTGKVLIAGGSRDGTAAGALDTAELFDPLSDTFSPVAQPMTAPRVGMTATLLSDGRVLLAGGQSPGGPLYTAEVYDPSAETFTATGNLNSVRTGAAAQLLSNGLVLIAGGSSDGTSGGALQTAELFDPAGRGGKGAFSFSAWPLTASRWQPESALLTDGRVLIAGGMNAGGALASAEIFDPVGHSFTANPTPMAQARVNGATVPLPDGTVLFAGGTTSTTAEIYDPAGARFTTTGSLLQSDKRLAGTLLNNGKVLAVGLAIGATAASDAEVFGPLTGGTQPPTITKSFSPTSIPVNGVSTITLTITNPNVSTTLTGVNFSDNFTPGNGMEVANPAGIGSTCSGTWNATPGDTFLNFGGGTLPAGTSCSLTVNVTGTKSGTITNATNAPEADPGLTGVASNTADLTVTAASTSTGVAPSLNPSVFGQSITFTATVTDTSSGSTAQPTGSVQFVVDGVNFGSPVALTGATSTTSTATSQATASLSVTGSPHSVTANYVNADGNFSNSTGALSAGQTVTAASTSTGVTSNPSVFGQSISFTATVTDTSSGSTAQPTGSVQFVVDSVNFGSPVALTGATSTTSTATSQATASLATGSHTVQANYVNADGNFSNSTGSLTGGQTVSKGSTLTTVTSSQNSSMVGQSVTFTATVSAASPATGTPTGTVTFKDGSNPITCTSGSNTLSGGVATCTLSTLAAGNHSITGNYNGDSNFTTSTGTLTGNPQVVVAAPTIGKGFNPSGIQPNGVSTMTITISNPAANTVAETGVQFTDNFPANVVVASPNGLTNSCGGTATAGSGTVSLTGGTIGTNSSCTVSVNVTAPFTGSYLNSTGPVSSTNGGTGSSASAILNVANPPIISKLFLPNSTSLNAPTLLSFTITNPNSTSTPPNNDVTLDGIAFTDALPSGLVVASPNGVSNDCGGTLTAVPGSSSISLTGGILGAATGLSAPSVARRRNPRPRGQPVANGSCFISVEVVPSSTGTLNNTTEAITSNESGQGATSNTASLTVTPPPNAPSLTKGFNPSPIGVGQNSALTFTVGNSNASTPFVKTAFSDPLPSGLAVASPNGLTGTCVTNDGASVSATPGSTTVSLLSLSLPANSSCSFTVNVTASTPGGKSNVTGAITASYDTGSETFAPLTGNTASAGLTVIAPAGISKAFSPTTIALNASSALTFTISNPAGNASTLHNLSFSDTFPPNLAVSSTPGVGGTCVSGSNGTVTATAGATTVSYSGGVLTAGSSCTITLSVTATGSGTLTNVTGAITSTETPSSTGAATAALTVLAPTYMNANSGTTPQSAPVTHAFGTLLSVTVLGSDDATPVPGIVVTFTAPGSGATGTFANSTNTTQATTNSGGVATATIFTANSVEGGPYTVAATASGLPTVNFSLTNTAGSATQMTANAGTTPQSVQVATAFGTLLSVTVRDQYDNLVPGIVVTFTAPGSGPTGTFANATHTTQATTNSSGVATATVFTAGTLAGGPYNVTATASGPPSVNFSLTNTAGSAMQMTANAGASPQSAQVTKAFGTLLSVTVRDQYNNLVPGIVVTFTAPGSGPTGTFANTTHTTQATTNSSGVATATVFTAGTLAGGPYNVTATASGPPSVSFSLTNTVGPATQLVAHAGTPQSAQVTTAFGTLLAAIVEDQYNNPVPGVVVTFTAPSSGATGTFANTTASTNATTGGNGIATATAFTANTKSGSYNVSATATGLPSTAFALTNTAGPPAHISAPIGTTPQATPVKTPFPVPLEVLLLDQYNNPVPGVTTTFTTPTSGPSATFANGMTTIQSISDSTGTASANLTANNQAGGPYLASAAVAGFSEINYALTNLPASTAYKLMPNPVEVEFCGASNTPNPPSMVQLQTPNPLDFTVKLSQQAKDRITITPGSGKSPQTLTVMALPNLDMRPGQYHLPFEVVFGDGSRLPGLAVLHVCGSGR